MGTPIVESSFPKVFDKRIREVFEDTWEDLTKRESRLEQLFDVMNTTTNVEEWAAVGSVPDIQEFTGVILPLAIYPGFYNKIEPKEYANKLIYERKFIDDKKFPVMMADAGGLFTSAHRVMEKLGVRGFANAFSSAFDFLTSEEGTSWCSTAHLTKSGVSTASGFSNAGTSALSPLSVSSTRLLMRRQRNDIGEIVDINPDTIICADALADRAEEINRTPHGLDTPYGNVNPQQGRYKIIPWRLLDDYSSKMWFMADSRGLKKVNKFLKRIAPEPHTYVDMHNTLMTEISIYFRVGAGPLDWRPVYGQNPA